MISAITGELRSVGEGRIHLLCAAFELEILVPAFDLDHLRTQINETITFHTIFDLEGDATRGGLTPRLIGFLRSEDREFFQKFVTVKGIGPKRALRALVKPISVIAEAIEAKNARALKELPEIGNRMAETIVAELSGKVTRFAMGAKSSTIATFTTTENDAIEGAMILGVSRFEAERLLDRTRQSDTKATTAQSLLREMMRMRSARA